jgi:hypothetical protein
MHICTINQFDVVYLLQNKHQDLLKLTALKKILTIIVLALLISACKKREVVDLKVKAAFTYEIQDNNFTVPVRIALNNKSEQAQFYKWTFEGGNPATYDKRDPGVISFSTAGNIKVKLEVWGDLGRDSTEVLVVLDSVPKAAFDVVPIINNFGTTTFKITNTSYGGVKKFNWLFAGVVPTTSTLKNPNNIVISTVGEYRIFLEALNDRGKKDTISKTVKVLPALSAAFDIVPSFDDEDYEAPLIATLHNSSISTTIHNWTAPGGIVINPMDSIPTVKFNTPGTYVVTYKASNGKDSTTITRSIVVKPNTGLRTFTNVKLGINTAQSTLGCYFSTILRTVLRKEEVTQTNGNKIDLAFYGLSQSFSFNLFVPPTDAATWAFAPIPNATNTKIINSQELCGCGTNFTAANFDNVINGTAFNSLVVTVTTNGSQQFNSSIVPRVVLFENANGKKGAIKIKQYVNNGLDSYILCDIKVQKD